MKMVKIKKKQTEKLKGRLMKKEPRPGDEDWTIDFKFNLKLYFNLLKKYWVLGVVILLVILIYEALLLVDKYLFKEIIDNGTSFVSGGLARPEFIVILVTVAIIFASAIAGRSILKWLKIHLINNLDSRLMRDLKLKFFKHILGLSHSFHVNHKTGSLISKIIRGSGSVERLTDVVLFNFAPLIFNLVVVSLSLIYFDWASAVVVFCTVIAFIGYSFLIQQMQKKANVKANATSDIEKANLADYMTNIESIKHFGKEKSINQKFRRFAEKTRNAFMAHWGYFRWLDLGQELILGIGTILILLFPLIRLLNGDLSVGTIVFIYTVYGQVIGPMFGFVWGIRNFYRSMADFEALFRYAKIEKEVKDLPDAKKLEIEKGEVEFRNISFRYGKKFLFKNFSLKIPKNKKIALVGHSGCGKTTLIRLLYRLYDVEQGRILIDGGDIRDFKQESLRSEMSIVPQECVLFDDTIYNNIAFSRPGASRKEVMKAIKFAQLDKIINEFPQKERTIVGERGVKLSGGEKQRVSIARAILADKKVLVLDEATSSLDSKTEYDIQRDLKRLMQGRTSIVIAHRLSTIMEADEIIVLEKGKIVQRGPHRSLVGKIGPYRKLWNLQKGGYIK